MCISLNPAEFKGTVIANFPERQDSEQERVLSYTNTALSVGTSSLLGVADTGPNAMIFPVYGEVNRVLDCDDPKASREWLLKQGGVYEEGWLDEWVTRGGSAGEPKIHDAGNYLVSIAADVEAIAPTLDYLRKKGHFHIPEATPHVLESMDAFYRAQALGMPQFVIAAFMLPPHHIDRKNPVTITYTQADSVADKLVFPALDYHGEGDFEAHVKRDHKLLLSTNMLNEIFSSTMSASDSAVPAEFSEAPAQFPISINDQRRANGEDGARAPNNDYIFDINTIHTKLEAAQPELEALGTIDPSDFRAQYERRKQVGRLIINHLGRYGVLGHSNQPDTTAQGFAESGFGDALSINGLYQDEI